MRVYTFGDEACHQSSRGLANGWHICTENYIAYLTVIAVGRHRYLTVVVAKAILLI